MGHQETIILGIKKRFSRCRFLRFSFDVLVDRDPADKKRIRAANSNYKFKAIQNMRYMMIVEHAEKQAHRRRL
jgi:hypothetical protein